MSQQLPEAPATTQTLLGEKDLKAFIDAVVCYFEKMTSEPAEVGAASIHFQQPPTLDFTGLVQISGNCSGAIYVTFPREMLTKMMQSIGEMNPDDAARLDFAGEMANTIAGNARQIFGSAFQISTPAPLYTVSEGSIECPCSSFVLPITWRGLNAFLVIALQSH